MRKCKEGSKAFFMAKDILLEEDMFNNSENLLNDKSMEAIFELNLGEFLTEHLISEEFAGKISSSSKDKTEKIKNQLKELISIYSLDNTLNLLGFSSSEDFIIYNSIANTVVQMLDIDLVTSFYKRKYKIRHKIRFDFDGFIFKRFVF
jgi:hypothetical protein